MTSDKTVDAVTPTERIQELSAINADVAAMLKAAGKAINVLSGRDIESRDDNDTHMSDGTAVTLSMQKQALEGHATAYFATLQAITARLRRQVYALEEAGIISSGKSEDGLGKAVSTEKITNGGLGNLDVGWLNSRSNRVGAEKENEILNEVKEILQHQLGTGG